MEIHTTHLTLTCPHISLWSPYLWSVENDVISRNSLPEEKSADSLALLISEHFANWHFQSMAKTDFPAFGGGGVGGNRDETGKSFGGLLFGIFKYFSRNWNYQEV